MQNPAIADFKTLFFRDFPYGTDPTQNVLDQDIGNAFMLADSQINQDFFPNQSAYSIGFLYLAAHYLVTSINNSSGGISGAGFQGIQTSKSVGSVSESYSVPQRILDSPQFAMLARTSYGAFYLGLILPNLRGLVFTVGGSTLS